MTLVDTNVILDLVTNDPEWSGWSIAQLEEAALKGPLCINEALLHGYGYVLAYGREEAVEGGS